MEYILNVLDGIDNTEDIQIDEFDLMAIPENEYV